MDIKKMQAMMLSQGIRLTDDDPIFAIVTMNEHAVNEANSKHLEQLNTSLQPLQKFKDEILAIGRASILAAEMVTIGRQFLSGENEQILEDFASIKESLTLIEKQISKNVVDRDRLSNVIDSINTSLAHIANSTNPESWLALQARNETFLKNRVHELLTTVQQFKDIEPTLQASARDHIETLLRPALQQLTENVHRLSDKNTAVMRMLTKTTETQHTFVANLGLMVFGVSVLLLLAGGGGYLLRLYLSG